MPSDHRETGSRKGFTLIEILVVAALSTGILLFMQMFFSQSVRSTLKGTDTLESIRAASLLFSRIREDLQACQSVDTGGASITMGLADTDVSPAMALADTILFAVRNATTTYSLVTTPKGKFVRRTWIPIDGTPETRDYGIPRIKKFQAIQIWKRHRILSTRREFGQILVNLLIDSEDPRMPTQEIRLSSFFVSSHLSSSNWNYVYLD